ncbi:MAG: hypothetical protein Q8Q60_00095 [Candidatus Chromulinivorax sp.]|nr:hypothetical protein [Candidatus Chromulinivorax sp.]
MEDIVGIKFVDAKRGEGAVITWGRLFHVISDKILLEVVKKVLPKFGVLDLQSIELCYSLMEISDQPYFHEQLSFFIKRPIVFGSTYKKWVRKKRIALQKGREILFTGFKNEQQDFLERNKHEIVS